MGPQWQYCTALSKDIIHSGPPGRDQGSGKNAPLKGGHALYLLLRANDCILQTGNQGKRHKHKIALSKLMQINTGEEHVFVHSVFRRKPVAILNLTFTLPLWTPSMCPFVPSLPLFPFSHSPFIPFHSFIFLFVQYLQYCAQLCMEWGRSQCVVWVDSPLGATGSVCEGRGTLFLGGWVCWGVGFALHSELGATCSRKPRPLQTNTHETPLKSCNCVLPVRGSCRKTDIQ